MKTKRTYGATVHVRVDLKTVGRLLHRLEDRTDIHVLHRYWSEHDKCEIWTLRSDQFLAKWEGHVVHAVLGTDSSGLLEFRE